MVEMIIHWWHPLSFLGAWLSVHLVCCAVLVRQNQTWKIIQLAGLFCRLCSDEAWGKLAHSLLLPFFFFPLAINMWISQVWDLKKKKGEPHFLKCRESYLKEKKSTLCWPIFPFSRETPFSPSHDMFNIANIHVLSVYEDYPKLFSFTINRNSCADTSHFSAQTPLINQL